MSELEVLELRDHHPELLERALEIERVGVSTLRGEWPKGLGIDVSWQQIIDYDAAQMSFIPRVRRAHPCECYDGD
jgi:predicted Ser/Thr protein kinase